MPEIAAWLARLGLSKYAEVFAAHEVDFEALQQLSDNDLRQTLATDQPIDLAA